MRYLPLQYTLIWHSYLLMAFCGVLAARFPIPASCAAILLLWLDSRLHLPARLVLALLLFCAGAAWTSWQFHEAYTAVDKPPQWLAQGKQRLCGQIDRVQGMPNGRLRVALRHVRPETGGEGLPGLCAWTWDKPLFQPLPGQSICITRHIRPVRGLANSASDGYEAYSYSQKIYWRMWSKGGDGDPAAAGEAASGAELRHIWEEKFLAILHEPDGRQLSQAQAILPALLFGDRFYLIQDTINLFARGTLAHSLALSGQHLAMAGSAGWLIIVCCALFHPAVYLWRPRIFLITAASIPWAAVYLWLGNAPPSLLRAAGMLFFACLFLWRKKAFDGLDILALAIMAILLFNPLAAFNIGLQLSALCVAAILISWPAIVRLIPCPGERRGFFTAIRWRLGQIFVISLLIQMTLLPLQLMQFQQAGLFFPLNVLWLPLLSLIILPAAFLALFLCVIPIDVFQIAAAWAAGIAIRPCQWLLAALEYMHRTGLLTEPAFLIPHWSALLAYAVLACGLAWLLAGGAMKIQARTLIILALVLLAFGPGLRFWLALRQELTVEALDAGQGQAMLITAPGGLRLLADGGGSWSGNFDPGRAIVAPHLSANHNPTISAAINTHPDLDHLGGLFYIISQLPSGYVFHNGRDAAGAAREKWTQLQSRSRAIALTAGDEIIIGNSGLRLQVLHPPAGNKENWQGNGASLVLRLVRNDDGLALFTGDLTAEAQRHMLSQGVNMQAQVVVAPHHGSGRDMVPAFYEAARPHLVIVCCGRDNRWRYPSQKLRRWLSQRNIPLLDTGHAGRISITWDTAGHFTTGTIREAKDITAPSD